LLAAGRDDDLAVLVLDAVIALVPLADRAPQVGNARHRRVAREVRVERGMRRRLHRIRRVEIGLPGAEIDHLDAGAAQSIDGRRHLHRRRRGNASGAIRELHAYLTRPFPRRCSSTSSGTRPCTRPPSANTSLINRELIYVYCSAGIMNTVSIFGFSRW